MIDARSYVVEETLRNGQAVTIRAIGPDDKMRVAKAFKALDRESIYTRLFSYRNELGPAAFAWIDAVDFTDRMMPGVTIRGGDDETVIGAEAMSSTIPATARGPRKWPSPSRRTIKARASPVTCSGPHRERARERNRSARRRRAVREQADALRLRPLRPADAATTRRRDHSRNACADAGTEPLNP